MGYHVSSTDNMDYTTLITLGANVIITPTLVLATMWVRNSFNKEERRDKRDDKYLENLELRVRDLEKRLDLKEKEMREIRVELKNRDAEYIELYKIYTTLKAQHEVLQADHDDLKKQYDATSTELANLKEDIKRKADEAAANLKTI